MLSKSISSLLIITIIVTILLMNVFSYKSYKEYLIHLISEKGSRGFQRQLSQAAGCSPPYLSQVLKDRCELTPEHGLGIAKFLGLPATQQEYFLALVDFERAGTKALKTHLNHRLQKLRESALNLKRLTTKQISLEHQSIYYSAWYFSAIHILTSIPGHNDPATIAEKLTLPVNLVNSTLQQLEEMGCVRFDGEKWSIASVDLHLPSDSHLHTLNLSNWHQRAQIAARLGIGLHYSGIHSISTADSERFKLQLLELIEKFRKNVATSPEQELMNLSLSWFPG